MLQYSRDILTYLQRDQVSWKWVRFCHTHWLEILAWRQQKIAIYPYHFLRSKSSTIPIVTHDYLENHSVAYWYQYQGECFGYKTKLQPNHPIQHWHSSLLTPTFSVFVVVIFEILSLRPLKKSLWSGHQNLCSLFSLSVLD